MFTINYAATALVIKKVYGTVPIIWILISVQVMELLWVMLNFMAVLCGDTAGNKKFGRKRDAEAKHDRVSKGENDERHNERGTRSAQNSR